MSPSEDLQTAVYQALVADADLASLVQGRIYDGVPPDARFPYLSFGPEDSSRDDFEGIEAKRYALQVDVWSRDQGRLRPCKKICDAVDAALHNADLDLTGNAAVLVQIDGMRVFRDPDGVTSHGVVTVIIEMELG